MCKLKLKIASVYHMTSSDDDRLGFREKCTVVWKGTSMENPGVGMNEVVRPKFSTSWRIGRG